jgi:hypothetical protein
LFQTFEGWLLGFGRRWSCFQEEGRNATVGEGEGRAELIWGCGSYPGFFLLRELHSGKAWKESSIVLKTQSSLHSTGPHLTPAERISIIQAFSR